LERGGERNEKTKREPETRARRGRGRKVREVGAVDYRPPIPPPPPDPAPVK